MPVPELEALLDAELLVELELVLVLLLVLLVVVLLLLLLLVLLLVVVVVLLLLLLLVSEPPAPDALALDEPPVPPLPPPQPAIWLAETAVRTDANPKISLNFMGPSLPVCAAYARSASSTSGRVCLHRWIPSLMQSVEDVLTPGRSRRPCPPFARAAQSRQQSTPPPPGPVFVTSKSSPVPSPGHDQVLGSAAQKL